MVCTRCNNKAEIKVQTVESKDVYDCMLQQYVNICRCCKKDGEKVVEKLK